MKGVKPIRNLALLVIAIAVIALDQYTKQLILAHFRYGESVPVLGDVFSLTYVQNPGAAFGLLSRWDSSFRIPFFIVVPLVALVSIGLVLRKISAKDYPMALALSLVVGGAIGNLIDRMNFGYVVDFLDFHWGVYGPHFPAFNVADIAITVGVFFLILDIYLKEAKRKNTK